MPKQPNYDESSMVSAIHAVNGKRMSISAAAREFCVPRKTLDDRVKGVSTPGFGPARMLLDEEEDALVQFALYSARMGFPLTREIMRSYVRSLVKNSSRQTLFNLENGPSDEWFRKLLIRHPELTEKRPEKQERSRARMSSQATIDQFFDLLEKTVTENNITDAAQIFNCDETGWTGKEGAQRKVLGPKGGHVYQQQMVTAGHTTAHLCVSANGHFIPTFVIFEKSLPHRDYKDGVPGNWLFGFSESGFMDGALFVQWFEKLFLPNCGKSRPVFLLMDNHAHISVEVIKLAQKKQVVLLGLPPRPHTTHILQPLDVGIIGPVKEKFPPRPHTTHILQPLDVGIIGPVKEKSSSLVKTWLRQPPHGDRGGTSLHPGPAGSCCD